MSSIFRPPSESIELAKFKKEFTTFRNIALFQASPINVDSSGTGLLSTTTPTAVTQGNNVFAPIIHTVTKDIKNLYHTVVQSGTVLVQDITQGANVVLHFLDQVGSSFMSAIQSGINGFFAWIKPLTGQTLTLKKATDLSGTNGNFYVDFDITLKENQQAIVQWHNTLGTKGMWTVVSTTPTSSSSGSFANQQLSNLVGPTAINQDINMTNNNIQQIRQLVFNSTGGVQFISTSTDGKVYNFTLNNLFNLFTMSDTNQGGVFQVLSGNSAAPASLKTFNSASPLLNQVLGSVNFDGFSSAVQKSYVVLSAIVSNATGGGTGKFLVSDIQNGTLVPLFSVDGNNNTVTCQGSKLTIYSTQNDPLPNGLPLTIDTLGSFAAYSNNGGHLWQNVGGTTFYFGAFKPNVFYQGIQMVTNARTNSSYTVDATNGAGSDLIITMSDNSFTRNVTLPDATQYVGRLLIIKNIGTRAVFLVTQSGQTVDGQASGAYTLTGGAFGSVILFASAGQWYVAGKV